MKNVSRNKNMEANKIIPVVPAQRKEGKAVDNRKVVHSRVHGEGIDTSPSVARGCVSEMQRVACQSRASDPQGHR